MISKSELYTLFPGHESQLEAIEAVLLRFVSTTKELSSALPPLPSLNESDDLSPLTENREELGGVSAVAVLYSLLLEEAALQEEDDVHAFKKVRNPKDIETLHPQATHIHLTNQSVINVKQAQRILERCPQLQVLRMATGLYNNHFGTAFKKWSQENNIAVITGQFSDHVSYKNRTPKKESYATERELFARIMTDPQKQADIAIMIEYNFAELKYAQRYYGDSEISQTDIAVEFSVNTEEINRCLQLFREWMGLEVRRGSNLKRSRSLAERIVLCRAHKDSTTFYEKLREEASVAGFPPPETLRDSYWEIWREITILQRRIAPQTFFDILPGKFHSHLGILLELYQIGEFRDKPTTAVALGKKHGITSVRASQKAIQALHKIREALA